MICYDRTIFGWDTTIWKSAIWGCKKNQNIEKITFKIVQIKFLAMHITNQKLSFDIFTIANLLNILIMFGIKGKMDNFDPHNVFFSISTNILVLFMTAFVLQGHIYKNNNH